MSSRVAGWPGKEGTRTTLAAFGAETIVERPKTLITYNTSPDISFDRTINPYKGCEHGCICCFARPNHAYRGLSPGLDFETKIFVKPSAAAVLTRDLAKKSYKVAPIMLAGDTDIYQPIERELKITRGHPGSAVGPRSPGEPDHQVGAGAARPRSDRADGGEEPGEGRDFVHDAGPQAAPHDGTARRRLRSAGWRRCACSARPVSP